MGHNVQPRPHYLDIVIVKDGNPVWRAVDAYDIRGWGTEPLATGESRTFSDVFWQADGLWDQRADCGERRFELCEEPVEPSTYIVWGMVNVSLSETLDEGAILAGDYATVVTGPHELVITP